jgi:cysteine-rich repeat protein
MKRGILLFLFFGMFLFNFGFSSGDILSFNSGGNKEVIITSNSYIEGFFSGDVQVLSSCGNGILEIPYEQCDDGNYVSGDGCSSTCATEEEETGGGSGGGGGVVISGQSSIKVEPLEINRFMLINSNIEENIGITNLNTVSSVNFSVYSSKFDPDLIVNFWDNGNRKWVKSLVMNIPDGEIEGLSIRFSAPNKAGIYNGTIIIDGKQINVILNVQENLTLFDSNIIVLNKEYFVPQGDKLRTSVTLIPLGDKGRMDVTLNYIIKDYDNKIYLTRSETVLVEEQVNFRRDFDTGFLPTGKYVLGLELIYPNGVAPSSAHFEVIQRIPTTFFGRIVFFLVNSILIVLILLIFMIIFKLWKQIRENILIGKKFREKLLNKGAIPKEDREKKKENNLKDEKEKSKMDISKSDKEDLKEKGK